MHSPEQDLTQLPPLSRREAIETAIGMYPRLRRFAYGLCGSSDEADELVQTAFERALKSIRQWQPGTRVDSWMYRIIQNLWLNQRRADRVRGLHLPVTDPDRLSSLRSQQDAESGLLLERVQRCIETLPDDQKLAVLLVSVEGLSYREAAGVLEISEPALTSRLARGRRALLEQLEAGTSRKMAGS
ncbi:DNA-directed RNA polymerase sigma-70 factor [Marinobacterium nitratireducens]|uniref:DNA-directed RNA polymerase sigma-70 factor n=1 Tax=Marinobacterium nitratireducens TaxID=518897 RepID=A0A917ZLY3_9GAMM|nr:RNA polymerase sigma factor [Marinobacterium nitratireducens]GGO85630.1 DNA-directed RNA polymerase sigma-70 factor [Marinobacterium nitratireducens]